MHVANKTIGAIQTTEKINLLSIDFAYVRYIQQISRHDFPSTRFIIMTTRHTDNDFVSVGRGRQRYYISVINIFMQFSETD